MLWIIVLKEPLICRINYPIFLSLVACSIVGTLGSINYCSSITLMSYIGSVCYKCTYYCAFLMVCIWPLSPSSCGVNVVAIVVTNWVVGNTSIVVTYLIDFVWAHICRVSCSIEISIEACFSNCVTIYSSTTFFVVFPPLNSTSGLY